MSKIIAIAACLSGLLVSVSAQKLNKKGELRVLASFDNVTKAWVARADLEESVRQALSHSLLAMTDPKVLKNLKVSGFLTATDQDYAFVRKGMKVAAEFAVPGAAKPGR